MMMTMMIVTGSRDPVSWVTPLAEFPSPLSDCSFEDLFMPLCKMQNKIQKQPKEIRSSVFLLRYLRSLRGTFDAKCNLRPIKQSVKLSFEYTGSLCMRRHIARTAGNCSNNNKKKKNKSKGPQNCKNQEPHLHTRLRQKSRSAVQFSSCSSLEVTTNPANRQSWIRGHWCLTHWHWLVLSWKRHSPKF